MDVIKNWQDEEQFRKETWQRNASRCSESTFRAEAQQFCTSRRWKWRQAWKSIRWVVSKCGWGHKCKRKAKTASVLLGEGDKATLAPVSSRVCLRYLWLLGLWGSTSLPLWQYFTSLILPSVIYAVLGLIADYRKLNRKGKSTRTATDLVAHVFFLWVCLHSLNHSLIHLFIHSPILSFIKHHWMSPEIPIRCRCTKGVVYDAIYRCL